MESNFDNYYEKEIRILLGLLHPLICRVSGNCGRENVAGLKFRLAHTRFSAVANIKGSILQATLSVHALGRSLAGSRLECGGIELS